MTDGYRIEPFTGEPPVDAAAVLEYWRREDMVLGGRESLRVHETAFVAIDPDGELAGECSAYLQRVAALRLDLWFVRVSTGREHRIRHLATELVEAARARLQARHVSGEDTRAAGVAFEIENRGLGTRTHAVWPNTKAVFLGLTERGHHLRVNYFPGVTAPEPPA